MQLVLGVMQGRLSPPEEGRFQSFPRKSWQAEIARARDAGVSYIEWIYDEYGASVNPITSAEGVAELTALKAQYGVETPAICGDWLMDFPLVGCPEQDRLERERVLHRMLYWGKQIGASRIILPFVDASSIKTPEEKDIVLRILERALPVAENTGVELQLEADFGPVEFADFLKCIPHPMVRVNYDTGNSSGLGFVAREEFAAYGDRIGSIHIKDRLRKPGGGVATKPLGEGSADFREVFACIRGIGYSGGFTLQVARGKAGDEINWIKRQVDFVRHHWN